MRRVYILSRRWLCFCMVLFGYKWPNTTEDLSLSSNTRKFLCYSLNLSIFSFVVMWILVLNVVVSWRCCECSIIREHFLLGLLQLWMVKLSMISGETYGVPFVGFLFVIELSSSVRWSLRGIGTSVVIVLLMRGKLTRSMLYHKDVYRIEHSLVDVIVLFRADVLLD